MTSQVHGGHIWEASEDLGLGVESLLDFSANLNPCGPPQVVNRFLRDAGRVEQLIKNYPREDYFPLIREISEKFSVSLENIVVGNGATELLKYALKDQRKILVPEPTYAEYEKVCGIYSIPLVKWSWNTIKKETLTIDKFIEEERPTAVVVPLPNNPTSDLLPLPFLKRLFQKFDDITWIVDASFLMFSENFDSYWSFLKGTRARVVMSLTKYYTLPGLRLGWMHLPGGEATKVREVQDPWRINAIASEIGCLVLREKGFDPLTQSWFQEEKLFFHSEWSKRAQVFPERADNVCANFILVDLGQVERKNEVISHLYKRGILVRDCENFGMSSAIRLAIKDRDSNVELLAQFDAIEKPPLEKMVVN